MDVVSSRPAPPARFPWGEAMRRDHMDAVGGRHRLLMRGPRRATRFVSVVALVAGAIGLVQAAAAATPLTYTFQLDGDVAASRYGNFGATAPAGTYDWSQFLSTCSGAPKVGCATNGDVTVS